PFPVIDPQRSLLVDPQGSVPRDGSPPSPQEVTGYQRRSWRVLLCHAGSVLSAGLLLLLFHWKPSLEVQAKCQPCALGQADWLIIRVSSVGLGWGSVGLGWGSVGLG
uniref:Cation-transporting ATPase n=1 Tax=Serinus canaria TaxID=9135 RepID=A0A8C9MEQ6_SERCA